jgi:heat shock protein HslJ
MLMDVLDDTRLLYPFHTFTGRGTMKRITMILWLVIFLAACGESAVEPTIAPTAEPPPTEAPTEPPPTELPPTEPPPTAEPTEETPYVETLDHTPDPELVGKRWAWIARTPADSEIAFVAVARPEKYTLTFKEDGSFSAQIDCNLGAGQYATPQSGEIYMELGPMTMVACPEGSLAPEMTRIFGETVEKYRVEAGGELLVLPWRDGSATDTFRKVEEITLDPPEEGVPTGTVNAPAGLYLRTGPGTIYPYLGTVPQGTSGEIIGISEDGEWWVVAAPNLRGGQVWVSAEWVEATNAGDVPVVPTPSLESTLVDLPWEWVYTTTPVEIIAVNDPTRYQITFAADGTALIVADCNNVRATYTVDGQNITIVPGPSTRVACPEDSLDTQFLQQLGEAVIYFVEGGNLYLDLPMDSGTMRFIPQGTRPPAPPGVPADPGEGGTSLISTFDEDQEGWVTGFADLPVDYDPELFGLEAGRSELPSGLEGYGLYLSGRNASDDLFMYAHKQITGLEPGTTYQVQFDVQLASNTPPGMVGIGGSPGEAVYVKAGAVNSEPDTVTDDINWLRMNFDKGNQASEGEDAINLGTIANPNIDPETSTGEEYALMNLNNQGIPFSVTSNEDGTIWLIIGTDSGFEGTTTVYYDVIEITLSPQ